MSSQSLATLPLLSPLSPLSSFHDSAEIDHREDLRSPYSDPSSGRSSIITPVTGFFPEQNDGPITTAYVYVASRSSAYIVRVPDLDPVLRMDTVMQAPRSSMPSIGPSQLAPPASIQTPPVRRNLLSAKKLNDVSSSASSEPFSIATVPSIVVPPGLQANDVRGLLDSIGPARGHGKSSSEMPFIRRPPPDVPQDQSFLRMSQTTETLSEYIDTAGRHRPSSIWTSSTQASGDTFGTRRRRWSLSSPADIVEPVSKGNDRQPSNPNEEATAAASNPRKRQSHYQDREASITAHLLQAASKNDYRIVPTSVPPSSGTRQEELREESEGHDSLKRSTSLNRGMSKVDQVLGVGAQAAAAATNGERKLLQAAIEQTVIASPGPLPPPRPGHKATASMPVHPASSPETPVTRKPVERHMRSESLDSVPSLHPSLSDSVNTLTHLLDHTVSASNLGGTLNRPYQATMLFRNELSADQRQILVRRVRRLEKRLGEPLREDEAGRLVVQPSQQGVTAITHVSNNAWPEGGPRRDLPEREREDCLPNVVPVRQGSVDAQFPSLQQNGSFAAKAKAAFGKRRASEDKNADIEVFVGREISVAETGYKKLVPRQTGIISPPLSATSQSSVEQDQAEILRRHRRLQIAKLSRLLGTVISPAQVASFHSSKSASSPIDDQSFIHFEEKRTCQRRSDDPGANHANSRLWANRIRQSITRRSSSKDLETMDDGASFLDLGNREGGKEGWSTKRSSEKGGMSEQEKTQARKRAQKLGQVFGDVPPSNMLPRPAQRTTYEAVHSSLQGLIYLADHDPGQLVQIVDDLDVSPPLGDMSLTPIPPKQVPKPIHSIDHTIFPDPIDHDDNGPPNALNLDTQSRAARLKRSGKLSHFFGESVDVSSLKAAKFDHLSAKPKNRRETIDGVLAEMWKAVQADVGPGGMKADDFDRLGDLMSAFKKKRDKMGERWEAM